MVMRVGSAFSGIGGLDLGLERAGMEVAWQIERDPYCTRVLEKHWPDVPRFGDIKEVTGHELEPVDLVCGGVPCQPWSVAGKREGQADDRDLWPDFWRVCRVVRPRYVLVEEVPGFAVPDGLGRALRDLAEAGYDASWGVVSASAMGAPHLRKRLFLIGWDAASGAIPDSVRGDLRDLWQRDGQQRRQPGQAESRDHGSGESVAHSDSWRREGGGIAEPTWVQGSRGGQPHGRSPVRELDYPEDIRYPQGAGPQERWEGFRSQRSGWWDAEPGMGRVAHGVPRRVDRLRGLGNAVVPQVAEFIGREIMAAIASSEHACDE